MTRKSLPSTAVTVCVDESANHRIKVSTLEVVEAALAVVVIASVSQGVDGCDLGAAGICDGKEPAPGVVVVLGHCFAGGIYQTEYVPLEVCDVVVGGRGGAVGVGQRIRRLGGVVGEVKNLCADRSVGRCGGDGLPQELAASIDVVVALRDGADQLHNRAVGSGGGNGVFRAGIVRLRFFHIFLVSYGCKLNVRRRGGRGRDGDIRPFIGNVGTRNGGVRSDGFGVVRPYCVAVGLGWDGRIVKRRQHIAFIHRHGLQDLILHLERDHTAVGQTVGGLNRPVAGDGTVVLVPAPNVPCLCRNRRIVRGFQDITIVHRHGLNGDAVGHKGDCVLCNRISLRGDGFTGAHTAGVVGGGNGNFLIIRRRGGRDERPSFRSVKIPARLPVERMVLLPQAGLLPCLG